MPKDLSEHSGKPLAGSPPTNPSSRPTSSDGKEASPPNAVPNLLLKLLEACAKHKRRHDREKNDGKSSENNEGAQQDWCQNELKSFARVLPRMEATIAVRNTSCDEYHCSDNGGSGTKESLPLEEMNDEDAVGHLCALYRAIARGAFCPHAFHYLFVGSSSSNEADDQGGMDAATDEDIAKGILPRIAKLLQYLALDPMRVALSPLTPSPNEHPTLEEDIAMYHQDEDIGSTIAALLNLLQDDHLRLSAVHDLINLSNDLSTIDECKALFDPPISPFDKDDEEESAQTTNGDKIRVHVFTEVVRFVRKRNENEGTLDHVVQIPSRRSLSALQLGVWTALQRLVPLVLGGDKHIRFQIQSLSSHSQGHKIGLLNSLLSSSRSTSLVSLRPSSREPHFLAWSYSSADVMVHSLLILRTKLAIVGLFTDMVVSGEGLLASSGMNRLRVSTGIIHDMDALALAPSVNLALMAANAANCHLLWGQNGSSELSENNREGTNATTPFSIELEHSMNSLCSWAVSNFMALVLFPDTTSESKNEIWSHSFPRLIDCIPNMADPSNECTSGDTSLCRMVLRVIHVILSRSVEQVPYQSTPHFSYMPSVPSTDFINQFRNRCLVRGYFSHLCELVKDSSESISGPAISTVVLLLGSFSGSLSAVDLVETACLSALGTLEARPADDEPILDTDRDSPLVRLGSKRRKLEPCQEENERNSLSVSIQSEFAHAISEALLDAQSIMTRLAKGKNHHVPISGGPEVLSLVSESDTLLLRSVAGALRILLSLRSRMEIRNNESGFSSTGKATEYLFQCVKFVSDILVKQKSDDKLVYVEPKLFYSALSSIVGVGLHACRVQKEFTVEHLSMREAISYCAIAAVPLMEFGRGFELDDSGYSRMIVKAGTNRLCGGICCRLSSMIGAVAKPYSDNMCLCGLVVGETNENLFDECGAFALDDILPLQCRCIFLAMLCPVASDSEQYEPTLSTIRCILTDSAHSQAPMIMKTALLGLPSLFLSLGIRKDGHESDSAKYLTILMGTFNMEDLVVQHSKSDVEGIKVSALLSLSRLARIYASASLVASNELEGPENDQLCNASSYLWQHINPSTNGMHCIILSLLSLDVCFTTSRERHVHPTLGLSVFSKKGSSSISLTQSDSPRQWLASLVYLQSILAIAPESMLRSSNVHGFFSDKRHYDIFDKLAREITGDMRSLGSVASQMPPSVWFFLMPFFCHDPSIQSSAAKAFGQILLCDGCKVFSAFFIPESEMTACMSQISTETARRAVNKLFSEIDFLMRSCGLGRNVIFSRELDFLPGPSAKVPRISDVGIAVGVFQSLCRWSPLNSAIGGYIIERSLLSLIRIWMYAFDSDDLTCHSSLASNAFGGLSEIFKCIRHHPNSLQSTELLKHVDSIMSKIFSEFFLPQHDILAWVKYRLLSIFIGSFLLPSSATQSLRAPAFEVSSVLEIMEFIDNIYPSVIVQMIIEEDHEGIQMCAAFRMYLLSEAKKLNKEEKRVQKKGLTEFIIGTRQENKRSAGQHSRSLVPGVSISTTKLIENAKLLCIKTDVISHVLPQLLLHPQKAPLRFFTTTVCQSELDYPDILREIGPPVLKKLVWELGGDDPEEDKEEEMYNSSAVGNNKRKRKDVRLALTKGFLLREGSKSPKVKHLFMSPSQESTADDVLCASTAGSWVAPNFMYLLVNLVLHQWPKRSEREQFQVIKSLRAMLSFLPASDSIQYIPQVMTAINNAISSTSKLHFIAVATLFDFAKIVTSHDASKVGESLIAIVVTLFPLFDDETSDCINDLARRHAVQLLEWLASGEANENLPQYFSEIPFLPFTHDLKQVRTILIEKGVQLDDIRLMSQQTGPQEGNSDNAQLQSRFYNRMNILSQLVVSHENQAVRKVVITHMTDLIQANRDLFQSLIVNEELSSMHFLTVVHDSSPKGDSSIIQNDELAGVNGGFVTKLLIRLLSRCVNESDCDIRDAIASCLGEIGAIDPNRLGKEILTSQFAANSAGSDSGEWRLTNPPWKTQIAEYQRVTLTRHLVSSLKFAPTTLDQHKISFAIQELLKLLDLQLGGENQNEMTPLLKAKLEEADVRNLVEPFWTSNYKQVDTVAGKSPPFFSTCKSNTYFSWISSFCRFLVSRSNANKNSVWGDFFHACRSAIRSQAGVGVAEFLLPLFILDAVCFGSTTDENAIIDEFLLVLSFEVDDSGATVESLMNLREREKAANAVFTVMDVLRHWLEKETELIHQPQTTRGRSKRTPSNAEGEETSWPAAESTKKIERFLKRIPLSSCATAASNVGMRARALQFLEMEGRRRAVLNGESFIPKDNIDGVSKFLKSDFLDGVDLKLAQVLLGQLNDFDTMVYVAQKSHEIDLTKRLAEEAEEREMYEDWEGAFQAYEQLLDSRLNNEEETCPNSATANTKTSAQKGLLRCLLKLGRLESVLNQAYGMSKQNPTHGNNTQVCAELLPSAAEAAWRLGKWSVLDDLVNNSSGELAFDANARYEISFGRTMYSLHSKSARVFTCLKDARESVMSSLSSAARDGYTRSYPYLMQLHALREAEQFSSVYFNDRDESKFQQSFIDAVSSSQWSDRLELSTPDTTGSNAILNTRLVLSRMANEPNIEGLMWLGIGKAARKGGLHRVAENSLTQANVCFCKSLNESDNSISSLARESIGKVKLQVAKLKHAVGESATALKLIEDDIPASLFLMNEKQLEAHVSVASPLLQATEWMVCGGDGSKSAMKSSSEINNRYQTVLLLAPNWERAHFNYSKFLDSLLESRISSFGKRAKALGTVEECQEYLLAGVKHYGMALQLGQKHVYQALPRLLAMWLEFTSLEEKDCVDDDDSNKNNNNDEVLSARYGKLGCGDQLLQNQELVNNAIKSFASTIPEHLFYTALPQLISRVLHNNVETSKNVALILRTVLAKYPRQSLWSCGWLRFSKSGEKKKAGDELFQSAQKMSREIETRKSVQNVLSASKTLFQFLISLAQFTPKGNHSAVKMRVPKFDTELKNFIPPIQAALSLSPGVLERSATVDVFPSFVPRMRAFNPELKIMQSKAKPKKVSIFAIPSTVAQQDKLPTNGHSIAQDVGLPGDVGEMHFLVKQEAKGDLRKDSRVQDLNNVINRIFANRKGSSGPNSRRRRLRLQLRTFSVVCLAEDCGILEWVHNTESLRSVITETYNPQLSPDSVHRRGSRITNFADPELRNTFQKCQDVYFKKGNLDLATKKFDELILKQYLPVMYWWFAQNFSSPRQIYEARTNFTLSTAVWSAVGHIIGLGDRHSENILIDTSSGECVHVDFDCIFDKGLDLPKPEVIPFRLTPNMLDAFGPTGADGLYAGALTESMRTLRENRHTLLSVLEPFLKDPVINFKSKSQKNSKGKNDPETSIAKIEGRLKGEYNLINPNKSKKGKNKDAQKKENSAHITQLSVEGQVQKMIMEATSHENLVQVYVGWMPWI